jgi:ribosomal protein L25 (general stress protein Ctc)
MSNRAESRFTNATEVQHMTTTILLSERSGSVKKLRAEGHIPAVVYSSRMDSEHVTVPEKEIRASLKRNPHAMVEPTAEQADEAALSKA